jgi:hypothetical protein
LQEPDNLILAARRENSPFYGLRGIGALMMELSTYVENIKIFDGGKTARSMLWRFLEKKNTIPMW